MHGENRVDPAIVEAAREAAAGDPRIVGLYLFGSQATGETHARSDVDLGVLFREEIGLDEVIRLESRFEERLGRSVDLVDLGTCNAYLALAAVRGERIFERDTTVCDLFDLYVLRRAADLAPYERVRRRMLLEPIARAS
ncbi:MAG TPA: nucleotidyltransferase domain-containing protein [Thermoanaerobaculia bacterium]|nr:nucleotidyltransferase domain-containing protein [Thermoanaerobaculia bacterium]